MKRHSKVSAKINRFTDQSCGMQPLAPTTQRSPDLPQPRWEQVLRTVQYRSGDQETAKDQHLRNRINSVGVTELKIEIA